MRVYLINGESYILINEKLNEIVGDSKNITTFDLSVNTLEDVIIEAGYFSMFESEKFIIVKNAPYFGSSCKKETEIEQLINFLEREYENTTIIFLTSDKIDSRKKITKLIKDKYNLIVIPNLKPYEIENKLRDYFKKSSFNIDSSTIKYIIENSLNNYDIVMSEVSKIMLYYKDSNNINYNDIENIVSKSINTNNFLFVDAIVDNDLEKSLDLLNDLKIMKVEPTMILSLIARDFRIMLNIKNLLANDKREYEIMNELSLQDWQLDKYLKKIFPYKIKELESILLKLSKIDLDIKSGKKDKFIALELFILDICG